MYLKEISFYYLLILILIFLLIILKIFKILVNICLLHLIRYSIKKK